MKIFTLASILAHLIIIPTNVATVLSGHISLQVSCDKNNDVQTMNELFNYWNSIRGNDQIKRGSSTISISDTKRIVDLRGGNLIRQRLTNIKVIPPPTGRYVLGLPSQLFPIYLSFLLESIAVGVAMTLLPFFFMELGANAVQLSLVVSAAYTSQMIGCLIMGKISDMHGRKIVLLICLVASTLSFFSLSYARSLVGVACAKIVAGMFGGLVPVVQSSVADVMAADDRPKFLGMISATFGLGFVLGPVLNMILPKTLSSRAKLRLISILPLIAFVISIFSFKETKNFGIQSSKIAEVYSAGVKLHRKGGPPPVEKALKVEVLLLVFNSFLLMYAFACQSIYGMFLKDVFGFGPKTLSAIFAVSGVFVGLFQLFLIKPLMLLCGQYVTLGLGNAIMAFGLSGVAMVRQPQSHVVLFALHILGYALADTACTALVTLHSRADDVGMNLSVSQSAQALAKVTAPLLVAQIYQRSLASSSRGEAAMLPLGALPFLVGAAFPTIGLAVPMFLFARAKAKAATREFCS